ncbi:MAG: hypothetical protein IT364_03470 [Candidatus Hydrogenedentes bacterium]|nr:hypothetical protein [Candidatus Hydrogenedentota bacterium]
MKEDAMDFRYRLRDSVFRERPWRREFGFRIDDLAPGRVDPPPAQLLKDCSGK